jgi:hypothetical protein
MSELVRPPELLKDVSDIVLEEASGYRDVPHYVYNLGLIYRRCPWWNAMSNFVRKVDPIDSIGQPDPEKNATKNFLQGLLIGVRVVHHARNADFLEAMARAVEHTDFEAVLSEAEDDRQRSNMFIETVRSMGHVGLSAGDPNAKIIEPWVSQISNDITTQEFATDGFGFALHVSHEVGRILTVSSMYQQIQEIETGSLDWDSGWAELGTQ